VVKSKTPTSYEKFRGHSQLIGDLYCDLDRAPIKITCP